MQICSVLHKRSVLRWVLSLAPEVGADVARERLRLCLPHGPLRSQVAEEPGNGNSKGDAKGNDAGVGKGLDPGMQVAEDEEADDENVSAHSEVFQDAVVV